MFKQIKNNRQLKKAVLFILGIALIVSLSTISTSASAKSKTVRKMTFNAQNLKKAYYKKVDSKTTGVITLKGPKGYEAIQIGYNNKYDSAKNKEKASKNAELYMKQIIKYIKEPKVGNEIAIQYGIGSGFDRTKNYQPLFTISLNKNSYNKLKENKGDFTKLDKMDYFTHEEVVNNNQ